MGFLSDLKKTPMMKDGKIGIIWKSEFEKDIYKIGFEKSFSKSNKKETKNVTWPKGGHANHASGGLE